MDDLDDMGGMDDTDDMGAMDDMDDMGAMDDTDDMDDAGVIMLPIDLISCNPASTDMWGPDGCHLGCLTGAQTVLSKVSMEAPHGLAQMK
ncbi:hypothetical protein DPX16_7520 [Anabarilius grahami]|uniref:Uncharacterized protein n=1 Tax=Anabarilius grahami TaxID=495550 RepID=A0A3N0YTN8_ANAGA|nr:hypothetical protein DPX16_7520 [Anabarilius grahami]